MALRRTHFVVAGSLSGLPIALAAVLSFLRPDLIAPMVGHVFGYLAVLAIMLLAGLGVGSMLLGWWLVDRLVRSERNTLRGILATFVGLLSSTLFVLPALFLALFAPIVFAFMFGPIDPGPSDSAGASIDLPHPNTDEQKVTPERGWSVEELLHRARRRAGTDPSLPETP
ncbi:MAG: hypothetical protein HYZ28_13570 [Myxococcales bacterium]|nr:hypothetical protein [Myxococcales bacterium]